jgi:hypothetical protein
MHTLVVTLGPSVVAMPWHGIARDERSKVHGLSGCAGQCCRDGGKGRCQAALADGCRAIVRERVPGQQQTLQLGVADGTAHGASAKCFVFLELIL